MNKVFIEILLLTLAIIQPQSTRAEVNVSIGIALPAPVYSGGPPEVIVLPDTENVYVVPDRDFDMFFWNGWWWRPWEGRWYRSRYYNRSWSNYNNVPSFYYDVDPEWRTYYRDRNWSGHRWNYERIPRQRLKNNWKKWHSERYWQRNRTWNVEHYQPRSQHEFRAIREQRQERYQQRPEVKQYQEQLHKQKRQKSQAREQLQEIKERNRQPQAPQHQQPQQLHKQKRQQSQIQEQPREIRERKRQPQAPQHQQQSKEQNKHGRTHEQGQQKSHSEDAGRHWDERN